MRLCRNKKVQGYESCQLRRSSRAIHSNHTPSLEGLAITQDAWTLMTLTLNPGALKLIVLPVAMVDVTGTTRFGWAGVLLAVWAPCNDCRVPEEATLLNGSWKTRGAAVPAVFATYVRSAPHQLAGGLMYTLMITLLSAVDRTTLQNTVPVLDGRVLGRYSSPLFRLNNWKNHQR